MITKLDKSEYKYHNQNFDIGKNKLKESALKNLQNNINNNLKIKELKKQLMSDKNKNFKGCSIKFQFPGLDIDVATFYDKE